MVFDKIKAYYQSMVPNLPDAVWQTLEDKMTVRHIKKGEFLVRAGEICRHVSFVNYGLLRLYYLSEGKDISTGFVGGNDYASEYSSFLTQTPAAMNIEALEDTEVLNLSYNDMQKGYEHFSFFERFGRKIAEKLFILLTGHITRLLTMTPEQRYQYVVDHQPEILQNVPQYMIASFIGITPEHLSRIRKKVKNS
jgi:CRP/FNR family transcriptional regulator, anaerobic regulatory protein